MAKVQTESRRKAKRELTVLATDFGLMQMSGVKELIETATDYHEAHKKLMKIYNQKYFN